MSYRGTIEPAHRVANVARRVYNETLTLVGEENHPAQGLADLL